MFVYLILGFIIILLIEIIIIFIMYNNKKIEIQNKYEEFKKYNDNIIKLHKNQQKIDLDLDKQIKKREEKIKLKKELRPKQSIFNIPGSTESDKITSKESRQNMNLTEIIENNNNELEDSFKDAEKEYKNINDNSNNTENIIKMVNLKGDGQKISSFKEDFIF